MPYNLSDLIKIFFDLVKPLTALVAGFALLAFFKGLITFIAKSGDAKSHEEGRNLMIWGIIALFVMVSIFGILRFFYSDLGFTRTFGLPTLPTSPTQ